MSDEFRRGLAQLVDLGRERRVAMMCSEAVWWRCHRRIVADYLMARGEAVFHPMGNRVERTRMTVAAHQSDGHRVSPEQDLGKIGRATGGENKCHKGCGRGGA